MKCIVKKTMKTLMVFIVAFAFFGGINAFAAEAPNGVKQIGSSSSSVNIEWNEVPGAVTYNLEISTDNTNWEYIGYTSSVKEYIYGLDEGSKYYVRIGVSKSYGEEESESYSNPIQVITSIDDVKNVKQVDATTKSIKLQWSPVKGATGYKIYCCNTNKEILVGTSKTNSFNITKNIQFKKTNYYKVYSYATSTAGYTETGYSCSGSGKTVPQAVTGLKQTNWYRYIEMLSVKWNEMESADGYEIVLMDSKGKIRKKANTTFGSTDLNRVKRTMYYSGKVRAYTILNGKKKYGAWSAKAHFVPQPIATVKKTSKKVKKKTVRKLRISWKKISGVDGYDVYVSNNKKKFTKVASVNSKKSSVSISKFKNKTIDKKKEYQVYIVAKKKVGSKICKSAYTYYWTTSGIEGYTR